MNDSEYMRRALELARRGVGLTSPNPPVGAIIVKDGQELGGGWHHAAGEPHAEVEALNDAFRRHGSAGLEGATIYVTLEPCSTQGRTGPCTTAIERSGLARVVIGAGDPNPAHEGRAMGILEEAGIEVVEGIEEASCEEIIRAFSKVQKTGLPWLIIKTAMSLDGRITRPPTESQWLSGEESRAEVQLLRGEADAILTSGRTVRADDPQLTVRSLDVAKEKKQPWRVVLTSRDDGVPESARIRSDKQRKRTLIFIRQRIECVLRELVSEHGVNTVLVEAGGGLVGRLLDEGWADELVVYLTPRLTGGPTPATGGEGVGRLAERLHLEGGQFQRFGNDVRLRAVLAGTGGQLER
ncbi:MAG: bifunctional diaminohydroxyphosphoribosylaminopyrimidine deaminase/5-amino-6-(5-phosphoribosylamino)uracil reductase RibD [Roseibacillus sp.]